jgi:choline dehydrogenase-like flavoprotein
VSPELDDVCVIGTGAGGGVLAHALVERGLRVVSVEQGDALPPDYFAAVNPPGRPESFGLRPAVRFPIDPHGFAFIHELYAAADELSASPASAEAFTQYQIHAVNGLTNLWNGVSVRLAPEDFAGWPVSYGDLERHYAGAERLIGVCGSREGLPELPDGVFLPHKRLRPPDQLFKDAALGLPGHDIRVIPNRKAVETRPERENRCRDTGGCLGGCPYDSVYKFSSHLLPMLNDSGRFTLRAGAKAAALLCPEPGGPVTGLAVIDTRTGERQVIRAKTYVLAAGALETPRILFNSASAGNPGGLANSSGLLGVGLQDNPKVLLTTSLFKLWGAKKRWEAGFGDHLLVLARARTNGGSLFHCIGQMVHQTPAAPLYLPWLSRCPARLKPWLARLLYRSYATLAFFGPADRNPANRLTRSSQADRHGVPHVDVHYRESGLEKGMRRAMMALGEKLLRRASATLILREDARPGLGIHYAGTAAMSASPGLGVVDANLKCHDHPNLYICDASVVPRLPEKHLTLTVMALAKRLGERLGRHGAGAPQP